MAEILSQKEIDKLLGSVKIVGDDSRPSNQKVTQNLEFIQVVNNELKRSGIYLEALETEERNREDTLTYLNHIEKDYPRKIFSFNIKKGLFDFRENNSNGLISLDYKIIDAINQNKYTKLAWHDLLQSIKNNFRIYLNNPNSRISYPRPEKNQGLKNSAKVKIQLSLQ